MVICRSYVMNDRGLEERRSTQEERLVEKSQGE